MSKSSRKPADSKPQKPYDSFPLFPHATKRWCKKIRGQLKYFGPWTDDPDRGAMAALALYEEQAADLHAGRTPRATGDGATVADAANRFLTAKKHLLDAGEIVPRTFADYHSTCELIVNSFGKNRLLTDLDAADFRSLRTSLAKRLGPIALGNQIQRVRTVFKFGYDEGILDRPIRYGQGFARPQKRVVRKARAENGQRMFEAAEIRALLDVASPQLQAMIFLAANAGYGNSDCGKLPLTALDVDRAWLDFARPKTGIPRRCPLWPETTKALRIVLAQRPTPKDEASDKLVFLTRCGTSWHKEGGDNPIAKEFTKIRKAAGVFRRSAGFYSLRHAFETIGGESIDQVAVDHIMGHSRDDMASVYRERISDKRLQAVTNHVRRWLFPKAKTK